MRKATTAVVVAALGMVTSAHAENAVSYSFLEVGYVNSELDDLNVDGNGFGIRGSYAFTDLIHGFASYADQDYDFDIGVSQLEAGIGLKTTITDKLDLVGTFSYLDASVDVPGSGSIDDNGFAVGAGLRSRISEPLELRGEVKFADFDEGGSDTTFGVGARYYFTSLFALAADVGFNDGGTTWTLGARFDFDK